jgi:hypothetical protein
MMSKPEFGIEMTVERLGVKRVAVRICFKARLVWVDR